MFTAEERDRIRERVLAVARADPRITGGAVTGSGAVGAEDRWSDVDTAFGIAPDADPDAVLRDWTAVFERELDIVHQFDLDRESTRYRVFLLSSSLEVDVSLTPAPEFGPHGPNFRLQFGEAAEQPHSHPDVGELIGWGWIYVLSSRAAIERGRPWQAASFLAGVRDHALSLASVRAGLPSTYARGVDRLDPVVTAPWTESFVRSLDPAELRRALTVAAREYLRVVDGVDPPLAARLRGPLSLEHP